MCVGPLKYMSGLGLASQAVKKGGPAALISPAGAMLMGSNKKKPEPSFAANPYGG